MNLEELYSICDDFLITEANITHTGELRDFKCGEILRSELLKDFPKAKYIQMDMRSARIPWDNTSESSHKNEQEIRNGWRKYYPDVRSRDIVISTDADEVLYGKPIAHIVKLMNLWHGKPMSLTLTLNQFLYFINQNWEDCDFYGPVICHAGYYLNQSEPQWRYGGRRIKRPLGCHFSWVMTADEMLEKILTYSHRVENEKVAKIDILIDARESGKYLFGDDMNIRLRTITSYTDGIFPTLIRRRQIELRDELICSPRTFWQDE